MALHDGAGHVGLPAGVSLERHTGSALGVHVGDSALRGRPVAIEDGERRALARREHRDGTTDADRRTVLPVVLLAAADDEQAAPGEHAARTGRGRAGRALDHELTADADWQRLFIAFWLRSQYDEELRVRFAAQRADVRHRLAERIARRAAQQGVELELPPDDLATALLALSNGLAIERLNDPEAVPDDLFARLLARLL